MGLEAAHIKWRQAAGSDTADNGLALCFIHHTIFDLGLFTLSTEREMVLSDRTTGSEGLELVLLRFHGRPMRPAQKSKWLPDGRFIDWHRRKVFKGAVQTWVCNT